MKNDLYLVILTLHFSFLYLVALCNECRNNTTFQFSPLLVFSCAITVGAVLTWQLSKAKNYQKNIIISPGYPDVSALKKQSKTPGCFNKMAGFVTY